MQLQGNNCNFGANAIFRLPIACPSLRWRLTVILLQSVFESDGGMTERISWMRNDGLVISCRNSLLMVGLRGLMPCEHYSLALLIRAAEDPFDRVSAYVCIT